MIAPRRNAIGPTRRGMSLIEVMLVLALLVVLASISWPAVQRPLATQRLRKSADVLRTAFGRARLDAMSTGQTNVLKYTVESGTYTVERRLGAEYMSQTESGLDYDNWGNEIDPLDVVEPTAYELPDGITFLEGEAAFDTRSTPLETTAMVQETDSPVYNADGSLADTILFYPDGTTSTARIVLKNEHDFRIELALRGLTGMVRVGKPRYNEDIPQ